MCLVCWCFLDDLVEFVRLFGVSWRRGVVDIFVIWILIVMKFRWWCVCNVNGRMLCIWIYLDWVLLLVVCGCGSVVVVMLIF